MVQWLRLDTFTVAGLGLIPDKGTKITHTYTYTHTHKLLKVGDKLRIKTYISTFVLEFKEPYCRLISLLSNIYITNI